MGMVEDLIGSALDAAMAIIGGVTHALGQTGSIMLIATAAIALVWLAGRSMKL